MTTILPERLAELTNATLLVGSHKENSGDMCVMEAVAYIAGEPWSDSPQCACPVIAAFLRTWNDGIPDDETRTRLLKPLISRLVGTRSTPAVERRRSEMALDWLIRTHTVAWLRLVPSLVPHADALAGLPEITHETASQAMPLASAARDAARDAVWDAAWDAARDAVWDAARDAVWAAAWDAAGAAAGTAAWDAAGAAVWDAARDAVWDAVWAAAWDAAGAAAGAAAWDAAGTAAGTAARDALAQTVIGLQADAVKLIERMIQVGD